MTLVASQPQNPKQTPFRLPAPKAVDPISPFARWVGIAATEAKGVGLLADHLVAGLFDRGGKAPAGRTPLQRTRATLQAMDARMGLGGGSYAEYSNNPLVPASVWPLGQAIAAKLDLAKVEGTTEGIASDFAPLPLYGDSQQGYHPGIYGAPRFYDDNAWLGLDAMQAYEQTHDPRYLKQAQGLMAFIARGWVTDPSYAHPGGIRWGVGKPCRNTCDNAPAMELALHLYLATHDARYLQFAKQIDTWLTANLRSPRGLYWDRMDENGHVNKTLYTYNQGTPIGADVLFYKATGDRRYLDRARQTADAALAHFGKHDRLWKEAPEFNAIFFRNLMALDAVAPDPRYRATLRAYADRAWKDGRDPRTGLFTMGNPGSVTTLSQAGMAQIFALLAMKPRQWSQLS